MEHRLPEALESLADPDVLWTTLRAAPLRVSIVEPDAEGRFVLAAVDMTGLDGGTVGPSLVGQDVTPLFDASLVETLEDARRTGRTQRVRTSLDLPGGARRVIDAALVPLPSGSIAVFTYDLTESVTAVERAREYATAIVRASPDQIWVTARDLTIRHYDGPPGSDAPRDPVGKNMTELFGPGVVERSRSLIERTIATGQPQSQVGFDERRPGRVFETRMVPLGQGEVLALVRDVSAFARAQSAAEQRAEMDALSANVLRVVLDLDGPSLAAEAEHALSQVARLVGADTATLGRRLGDSTFERHFVWADPRVADAFPPTPQRIHTARLPEGFEQLSYGEPIILRSVDTLPSDSPERAMLGRVGAQSALVVPIERTEDLAGYLSFYWLREPMPEVDAVLPSIRSIGVTLLAATRRSEIEEERRLATENLEHALDALRVNEERFRLLSRATNDVLWDWNLTDDSLWWGEGIATIFGYDRAELEPTIESWAGSIHPDDLDRVLTSIHRAIDGGRRSWMMEYRFMHRRGDARWVLDRGEILRDDHGRPVRMIGGMRDVTDRRRTEDLLRDQARLLDLATDIIYTRDLDHRITYWNRSAERAYGWRADEALGRSAIDLLHVESGSYGRAMKELLAHGEWTGEFEHRRADGAEIIVMARWTLVRDADGEPRAVLAINTDVTERRRWEQQLLRAQRMESIGTLAGGIAHDLNNVLTPILMATELLQIDESDPDRRSTLATVELAAQRGADLVRQVLSFARGVEGRHVDVVVDGLFTELAAFVRETLPRNIEVKIEEPAEELHVSGDPTQLSQVLLNLCVNARDAMPQGGTLEISAERRSLDDTAVDAGVIPDGGDYVVVRVSDTGTGIADDIAERIFEPFFTTKEVGVGTGLGLATATAIVRGHGGLLEFESEPGRGTTFSVYLPSAGTGRGAHPSIQNPAMPRGHGEVVLVVDDEQAVLTMLRQVLKAYGYRVRSASNGTEVARLVQESDPPIDAVITDVMMPDLDGVGTVRSIRALRADVAIIAASGLRTREAVERMADLGVQHFLAKPYTTSALLTTLEAALNERAGARTSRA